MFATLIMAGQRQNMEYQTLHNKVDLAKLRAERDRLMQEKKERAKLRAERDRLMQEKCAKLRAERDRLMQEKKEKELAKLRAERDRLTQEKCAKLRAEIDHLKKKELTKLRAEIDHLKKKEAYGVYLKRKKIATLRMENQRLQRENLRKKLDQTRKQNLQLDEDLLIRQNAVEQRKVRILKKRGQKRYRRGGTCFPKQEDLDALENAVGSFAQYLGCIRVVQTDDCGNIVMRDGYPAIISVHEAKTKILAELQRRKALHHYRPSSYRMAYYLGRNLNDDEMTRFLKVWDEEKNKRMHEFWAVNGLMNYI